MKRWLCILLAALLLLPGSAAAFAADPPTYDALTFDAPLPDEMVFAAQTVIVSYVGDWAVEDTEDGAVLWSYTGSETEIEVPDAIAGEPVVSLCQTFLENTGIVSVVLPESVTALGNGAFYGCTALQSVTGGSITDFTGANQFSNCTALREAPVFSEGLEAIPDYAFYGCAALEELAIPATVTEIGEAAVYGCAALEELTLPDGLLSIGVQAFNWCTALAELDIPDSVTEIGNAAFYPTTTLIVGDGSYAQRYAEENGYTHRVRDGVDLTKEIAPNATTVADKADAIVAALVTEGMSDYEKALILHDYMILHATYDYSCQGYTAADILLRGTGVCQAYTYAYAELLNRAGITNTYEYGDDHVWNMACLDGVWVHIDCTWDDPLNTATGQDAENHIFFGVTNYALDGVDNHECYTKPYEATDVTRSYAWMIGTLPERIQILESELAQAIADGEFHGEITSPFLSPEPTRSRAGASGSGDSFGVTNRMIYQGAEQSKSFDGLSWNGYPVSLTRSFDSLRRRVLFHAFAHVPESRTIVLPESTVTLGDESLLGTVADRYVLPEGVREISESAFPTNHPFVLEVIEDSPAHIFALFKGMIYQFHSPLYWK